MNNWQKVKLKDVVSILGDGLHGTPTYDDSGEYFFINGNNLFSGKIKIKADTKRINANEYLKYKKELNDRTLLVSINGTIGNVATYRGEKCILGKSACYFNILPEVCKGYIYYILLHDDFQNYAKNWAAGTTIKNVSLKQMREYEFLLPSFEKQQQIVQILSSLDDKIELNAQINHNLEEQIRVLFEDFFINSQHCANWKQGTIADLGNVVGGSTPSKAKPEYYTSNGIAWITPKDLSGNKSKFISKGESDITPAGLRNSSAVIMPRGTVLFSSRAPIGYIAIAKNEITTNQGFKSVVPHLHIGTAFVYCFLKHNLPKIESMASGSTFKEVSGSVMKAIPAVIPAKEALMNFSTITQPLFDQQELLESENQRLTRLRDALLPKLMSGEIDVSEVEI